jgi:hypothetical protein
MTDFQTKIPIRTGMLHIDILTPDYDKLLTIQDKIDWCSKQLTFVDNDDILTRKHYRVSSKRGSCMPRGFYTQRIKMLKKKLKKQKK